MSRRRDFGKIVKDGTTFSIRWYEAGKQRRKRGFTTKTKAAARLAKLRVELDDGGRTAGAAVAFDVTVGDAISAYGRYLLHDKGNKDAGDTIYRLNTFFPQQEIRLADLTPEICRTYFAPRSALGQRSRSRSTRTAACSPKRSRC